MAKKKEKPVEAEVPAIAPLPSQVTIPEETPAPLPTVGGRYLVDGKLVNANGEEIKE